MGDQIWIPWLCCNNFFSFFPLLFPRRTAELPSLCTVVSSIYQLFVPHFTMALFMCIYLNYRINKQQDTSFEFSSILSTVDLSKHQLKTLNHDLNNSKIYTARQFCDFQCLLFRFLQSSMVKPAWVGTLGKWAIFFKETSIITGSFYL